MDREWFSSLKTTNSQHLYSFVLETAQTNQQHHTCNEYIHEYALIACEIQMNCTSPECTDFEQQKMITFSIRRTGGGKDTGNTQIIVCAF